MDTIAEKLNYLNTTKENIKNAIIEKGVSVSENDTFRSYAGKITEIQIGDDWLELGYPINPTHADYEYSKNIYDNWDANVTDCSTKYLNDTTLKYFPLVNTSNVTNMRAMFNNCSSLITVPQLDTSNVTNISGMFSNCTSLTTVQQLDTSNAEYMSGMFYNCSSLTTVPQLDTSNSTDTLNMFSNCTSLITVPRLDIGHISNATNMYGMFSNCRSLTTVQLINIKEIATYMFDGCTALRTLVIGNTDRVPTLPSANPTNLGGLYTYATESTIYVPQAIISSYQTATGWSDLYALNNNIFQPIEGSIYE